MIPGNSAIRLFLSSAYSPTANDEEGPGISSRAFDCWPL